MTRIRSTSVSALACALALSCRAGDDGNGGAQDGDGRDAFGGGAACDLSHADAFCDLDPEGEISGGCFAGTFTFGGDEAFPLSLAVDASASRFEGELTFRDSGASWRGRVAGTIDERGRLCGELSAESEGGDPGVRGEFSGATDGRRACGVWENDVDRSGQWQAERCASCEEAGLAGRCALAPEPAGAPQDPVDGNFACLGGGGPPPPDGDTLVLVGWVRRLRDPEAREGVPRARVEAYAEDGVALGEAFSDEGDGRVALAVPVREEGFRGHVSVSSEGMIDYRLSSSRPITGNDVSGWAWMVTPAELADLARGAGAPFDEDRAVVVGAVHDCDAFGVSNAVVRVVRAEEVLYLAGFDPDPAASFTTPSGRFAAAGVPPGPVQVEAYGRTEAGGPLVRIASAEVEAVAGAIAAVDLSPQEGGLAP